MIESTSTHAYIENSSCQQKEENIDQRYRKFVFFFFKNKSDIWSIDLFFSFISTMILWCFGCFFLISLIFPIYQSKMKLTLIQLVQAKDFFLSLYLVVCWLFANTYFFNIFICDIWFLLSSSSSLKWTSSLMIQFEKKNVHSNP